MAPLWICLIKPTKEAQMKKKNQRLNQIDTQKTLRTAFLSKEDILKALNSSMEGLSEQSLEINRKKHGINEVQKGNKYSIAKGLFDAFINPFSLVLITLVTVSYFTDIILVNASERNYTSIIIVVIMILIGGLLSFTQEYRSSKASEKLQAFVKNTASVLRMGKGKIEIPMNEVVVGDIILLAAGDMVPADVRLLVSKDLFNSQSALSGESEPVEKVSNDLKPGSQSSPLECENLAFMGSTIISGSATCIVVAVGSETILGNVAQIVDETATVTSFEKGITSVTKLLITFMFVMAPTVLMINGIVKGDWLEAVLFGLSIAVGLTPEMLPLIVSTNLAKGALEISKKKTIVKKLKSIQNFGAIDILCTDKTGTITQDKVILEMHLDIHGNEDPRVLRHAFLNSYYQTGLRNLMDVAILNHADEENIKELTSNYVKVDEIPFDFDRRRMSVVIKSSDKEENKIQLITKGAIEEMLKISSFAEYQGEVESLTEAVKNEIMDTVNKLNEQGMRVIGLAQKRLENWQTTTVLDESEMVLIGYLAFYDPPKETTKEAISALHKIGIEIKILTGDNEKVTRYVCNQVGLEVNHILMGSEIESMDDVTLKNELEKAVVLAKLSPVQKARVVTALRESGHIVGFMGDGINDAAAMKKADVAISVDTAVDIAKESADIILLEKDLMVLAQSVYAGRKTYGNIIKYIKMTVSSNFGNMFSVLVASALLPFLPMAPIQILALNLVYDFSCMSIPWDNMDKEYLLKPKKWNAKTIKRFMIWFGPVSSVFDLTTYVVMFFIICPMVAGGHWGDASTNSLLFVATFNAGWFVESLWTQMLVMHMIRTEKIPFVQSRASNPVLLVTTTLLMVGTMLPFTPIASALGLSRLPFEYFGFLLVTVILYMIFINVVKKIYLKKYGELL
jgi:Mg2+-importing ATPase